MSVNFLCFFGGIFGTELNDGFGTTTADARRLFCLELCGFGVEVVGVWDDDELSMKEVVGVKLEVEVKSLEGLVVTTGGRRDCWDEVGVT